MQLLKYFIQPEKLAGTWNRVLEGIQGPQFDMFHGVTLFASAKDLKYRYMSSSMPTVRSKFERQYNWAINPKFQARKQAFVDPAKQVTAQGSYLFPSSIPDGHEPQTFIYKRCCLESFAQWYCERPDQKGKKKTSPRNKKPEKQFYTNLLARDAANMTLKFPIGSVEERSGHVFSQFYSDAHAPFNAAKVTPFENPSYENLAVDPAFVEAIEYAGGVVTFNAKTCERGYLHSKNRANVATKAAQYKSYSTREEVRISLELFDVMEPKLEEQSQRKEPSNHSYYYTIPSKTLFGFLRSQINKFCFGFEHLYTQGTVVQWEKSQVMVYMLRMLRLCYSAHQLGREKELYKDQWAITNNNGVVTKEQEGLGLQNTLSDYGLGWFLPKIDWKTWTIQPILAPKMVFDNPHIQRVYQRRWQAVGRTVNASTLVDEARIWATKFNVATNQANLRLWRDYLFAINLQLFRECVGFAIKDEIRPRDQPRALIGQIPLCWDELSNAYATR